MTDDIPDDVVERAYKVYLAAHVYSDRNPLRAALRVAVEWEREQAALVADEISEAVVYNDGERKMVTYADGYWRAAEDVAAAIRSRKD